MTSDDAAVVTGSITNNGTSNSTLTVEPQSVSVTSDATITVKATDPGGLFATLTFVATVEHIVIVPPGPNAAPVVAVAIPNQRLKTSGADSTIMLSDHFTDPNGDDLTYSLSIANTDPAGRTTDVVATSINNTTKELTLSPGRDAGKVTVTMRATDTGDLYAEDEFVVTVVANKPPAVDDDIDDRALASGGATSTITLSDHFSDPDGDDDKLSYRVSSLNTTVATGSISGNGTSASALTVTPGTVTEESTATITVTARDPEGAETSESFEVTVQVANRPPVCAAVAEQSLTVEDDAIDLTVSCTDPDSHILTYTLLALPENAPADVTSSGSTVTISAVSVGTMTATLQASDGHGGTAEVAISITVTNIAPRKTGSMSNVSLPFDGTSELDVTGRFTDSESETLTYAASSFDDTKVGVSLPPNSSTLTLTAVAAGTATISVTATDPHRAVSPAQEFVVTVAPNQGPTRVGTIAARTLQENGDPEEILVAPFFSDPEGQNLTYAASSNATATATASITGSTLTVTPRAAGQATISVRASDTEQAESLPQDFVVTVCGTPAITETIPAQTILLGVDAEIALDDHFSNPNSGDLAYSTTRTGVLLTLGISEERVLTIEPEIVGSATVTVTADNGCDNSRAHSFDVTVRGAPAASGTIPMQTLKTGGSAKTLDVAPYFSEPDGDDITYSARLIYTGARFPDIVSVSMSESTLTMTPLSTSGSITVEVTATDTDGSATQSFTARVTGGS